MTTPISDALAELRRQFAAQLSTRIEAIRAHVGHLDRAAWQPDEAKALHRRVHGLVGLAGTFGVPSVSDAARVLENRLANVNEAGHVPTEAEWRAVGADLERLEQMARISLQSNAASLKQPVASLRLNHEPLIHLVEDDPDQAEYLSQTLRDDGYRVEVFTTLAGFRAVCAATDVERPAAVVMDMIFPEGDVAGADLLLELKTRDAQCPPVIFVSVRDDMLARLAAFRAGATRYLVKPVDSGRLIDLLDALTGRQPQHPYRVLLVDDDLLLLEAEAAVLRAAGLEVRALSQPLQILDVLNDFAPDVVVLDVYMPEATGPELAAALRERDAQLQLPILFLSAEADITQQLMALNLGGDDFLVKPVQPDHLVAAVTGRARRARQSRTVQQHLETALYEREREHLALDHHAIVSIADRAGKITYVNDTFCQVSGYTRGELLGQNHRMLKSGEHPPAFYKALWETIARGEVWVGELCNRRKNGSLYWVKSTITPFLDSEGKPYQYVSIRTDITHLRETELALRESEFRLAKANRMLQLVLDNIPVRVFWKDTELRFQGCNKAFAQDAGRMTPDDLIGLNDWDMPWAPEADAYRRDDRAIMQSRVPKLEYEEPQTTPTGERIWLSTSKIPLLDDNGQPVGLMGVYTDITERKQDELALIEAREEADSANQAKSEFLSSMSHELRTPMNAILGFSQLMEYDDSLPEEHKDNVREILKGGHHLLELINEVLDLAKLESGRIDLSLEPVEVCPIVQDCVGLVSSLANQRGISIGHLGLEGVAVRADRTRLKQALLNLLSNAVKYNREGGNVLIDVRAKGADRLQIRVTDNGPGIPGKRLAELFQPFNRLGAEATEIEGTGIGLTITRRIVEVMGGTVDVESEVGVGSTFWIELPLESVYGFDQSLAAAAADRDAPAQPMDAAQHTILYIEDNPSNIKLVAQILGRRPHIHLLTAHTPELGIELAMARQPELILLDINMPDMDGYQVLEVFKAEARLKTIPVVAITANAMPRDIERGKAAGFVDYLTKPLDVARFNAMLDRVLSTDSVHRDQP